tara:strand:- start:1988 stop:2149 length:162 start_codon:yes stop_codon:yes gene_type:complete
VASVQAIAEEGALTVARGATSAEKLLATCRAKRASTANFLGFPLIPGRDAVLR